MQNAPTLEKEFEQVKLEHMIRISAMYLKEMYIKESQEGIKLPTFLLEDSLKKKITGDIKGLIRGDRLEGFYNIAYKYIKESLK